ncbi:bacterial Ig-like domain protein [Methanobrevibacter cuticularis]|uniref:Bacterial Ig-like domain protein n=1 Tax=Methanobrevibacter cuticularis TaxID=47311 RepID=A0A166EY02_9EURY|nr:Ig-like domain repeat protein [Methanobrevibacter cuticularis]KZX17129.1 bacterial Ig-like domain protein [Methanobrevibacter cuticularis]
MSLFVLAIIGFSSNIAFAHDPFPPEIKFVSPIDGSDATNNVKIKVSIRTHTAINGEGVKFDISGPNNYKKTLKGEKSSDTTWECYWDTSSAPNGKYSIKAEAQDDDYPQGPGVKVININLNNVKKETKILINDVKALQGTNVNVIATLKDGFNKIITNKKIEFTINGKTYSATTDSSGVAKITLKGVKGTYTVNAKFLGDNSYMSSSNSGKLYVTNNVYSLKVSNIDSDKNKIVQLKTTLTYKNKKVANKKIKFYVNNVVVGTAKTNKYGIAVLKYRTKLNHGKYTVLAKYSDNVVNIGVLKVKKANVYLQITSNKARPKVGNTITIFYRVKNDGPDTASNTKLTYKIPSNLKYVKAVGSGSKKYNSKSKTFTWTISKAKIGTTLLKLTFKTKKSGRALLTPKITTDTYNKYSSGKKLYITIV